MKFSSFKNILAILLLSSTAPAAFGDTTIRTRAIDENGEIMTTGDDHEDAAHAFPVAGADTASVALGDTTSRTRATPAVTADIHDSAIEVVDLPIVSKGVNYLLQISEMKLSRRTL